MADVVALRHVAFEDAGLIEGLLARRGLSLGYLDAGIDDLGSVLRQPPRLLIVLGGPIGVYEQDRYPFLGEEIRIVGERLARDAPILGLCLGAQLIARAAGCRVYPGREKEIGYAPISLSAAGHDSPLRHLAASGHQVLHWHGDTFDLPTGATLLASTAITERQAFSLGPRVLGLQFHVEVEPQRLESWLIGHTVELAAAGIDVPRLRQAGRELGPAVAAAGTRVLDEWLDRALA